MASTALRQAEDFASHGAQLVARSLSDFSSPELLAQWDELPRDAAEPNPFFEHWFLLPALGTLDPAGNVRILCLESGDRLLGLIPLHRQSNYYGRRVPHWRSWVHPNCFLGTPLVAKGHIAEFWHALFAWADDAGGGLFLHLPELPTDGPVYQGLCTAAHSNSRRAGIVRKHERALLRSDLSPQDYFEASISKKRRKEFERRSRRLGEMGTLLIERQRDAEDISGWIDDFLALEGAGWKGEAGSALASSQTTAALFRSVVTAAAQRGQLDRLTIRLDGRPIAFLSSLITPTGWFGFKTAYDEDLARFSLGVILQRQFLEILDSSDFVWCDSCAAPDHPMIDHFWRERRTVVSVNLAIGGWARRAMFRGLLMAERGQPLGSDA